MEQWKLQTLINEFTDALDEGGHRMVGAAKRLRNKYEWLRNWEQKKEVLDAVMPYLDNKRPEVRQIAACVVMGMPIEKFSALPPQLEVHLSDANGKVRHEAHWVNPFPAGEQQVGWMEFVAKHMIYLEDRKESRWR